MSDPTVYTTTTSPTPRPVSLFTLVFVLALFAVFLFVVRYFYTPIETLPQNAAAENLGKEQEWRATSTARRAALNEMRQASARQASTYGWVDQKAGVVRLPIERAMELTVERFGGQNQPPPANPPARTNSR